MSAQDPRTTILVLHPATVDPYPYIKRELALQHLSSNITVSDIFLGVISDDSIGQHGNGTSAGVTPTLHHRDNDNDDETNEDDDDLVPRGRVEWTIDNKYYTALVNFSTYPQEALEHPEVECQDIDVIMYLFTGPVSFQAHFAPPINHNAGELTSWVQISSIPPSVVRVMAEPRDIALAIRIPTLAPDSVSGTHEDDTPTDDRLAGTAGGDVSAAEDLEEMFDEIGMEFLDETTSLEDDDERRQSSSHSHLP